MTRRILDERDIPCARVAYPKNLPVYFVSSDKHFNWTSPKLPNSYRYLHSGHSAAITTASAVYAESYYMEVSTPKGSTAREVRRNLAHLFGKNRFSVRKNK